MYKETKFIHLIIHAIFKSLIFLCTGRFIHYINRSQDIRDYRGIIKIHPFKKIIIIFSILSLCGFPFLCGFYSKDLIIEYFFINKINTLRLINLILGTIFTVSYSTKVLLILYLNKSPIYNNINYSCNKITNYRILQALLLETVLLLEVNNMSEQVMLTLKAACLVYNNNTINSLEILKNRIIAAYEEIRLQQSLKRR
ncbi:NADH-ubiquinone oxidoreductase chain 5 [Habropoda laboriosa]|uniref:NADH:ubiquinone reductase (H(+)-translocating) n=1 Tax=Habropoda laboriosa TaxID=597456 RepID=A0A0L7QS32_9HYME|nr:NADH-ubiquinone oxidoreductase chain 5 [Habropoda laboriosa]